MRNTARRCLVYRYLGDLVLTGGNRRAHVTDVTNASRTMLMNLKTLDGMMKSWRYCVSRVTCCRASYFQHPNTWGVTPERWAVWFLDSGLGDLGDQQAALVGQTCFSPANKNTYGTAASCCSHRQ